MDKDELAWAIEDVETERDKAIAQVVELTVILNELKKNNLTNENIRSRYRNRRAYL